MNWIKNSAAIFIICICICPALRAAEECDKELPEYETMLESGLKSGALYYNIANCYLEKGQVGKAILNYKRAMYFIPRDSAVRINYGYALSRMRQRDAIAKNPYFITLLNGAFNFFSLKETVLIFFICYFLAAALIIMKKFAKKHRFVLSSLSILFILATIIIAIPLSNKIKEAEKEAIIISRTTDAKIEPASDAPSIFPLYEGMKVYVINCNEGWCKIKRPDNKTGWIAVKDLSMVTSPSPHL
jgi:tetratricopeptide (TPR) repeat protein